MAWFDTALSVVPTRIYFQVQRIEGYNAGMQTSRHLKVLSVRLPEVSVRRVKSVAASRGVSVQDAVHQALDAWMTALPLLSPVSLDGLQGSLAGLDVEAEIQQDRELERLREQRFL